MEFEWDPTKREINLAKHKLDLGRGPELFDGRPMHRYASPREGEQRSAGIVTIDGKFVVVWTMRGGVTRLISLRRARDAEIQDFRSRHG